MISLKPATFAVFVTVSAFLVGSSPTLAADKGTTAEAEALVKKAVTFYKANGKDKAYAAFNDTKGGYVDRDLYLFCFDFNGVSVAHGANAKLIGKNLIDMADIDGNKMIAAMTNIAKTKGKGWHDYKFSNPVSKENEKKSAYVEKFDEDVWCAAGVYKG